MLNHICNLSNKLAFKPSKIAHFIVLILQNNFENENDEHNNGTTQINHKN